MAHHFEKDLDRSQDRDGRAQKGSAPKWTRKAAFGNSPVDCCNRRGFSAEKRVLGPPLRKANTHKRLTEVTSEEAASLSLLTEIQNCTLKTEHCLIIDAIMRRQQ